MSPAQCNYDIYDKELLAIVDAFKGWRQHLRSDLYDGEITVYSDYKNLKHFMTTKKLNQRQMRWMEELTGYNFKIVYREGKKNEKADALTRRSGDLPSEGDPVLQQRYQTLLKPENLVKIQATQANILEPPTGPRLQEIREAQDQDSMIQIIKTEIRQGRKKSKNIDISKATIQDNILDRKSVV